MSLDTFNKKEHTLKLKELLLNIKLKQTAGENISINEVNKYLQTIDIRIIEDEELLLDLSILQAELEYKNNGLSYNSEEIFKNLNKYKNKTVQIKTKEELIKEGFDVKPNGVFKGNKMYLNQSDLNYLGLEMKIVYKESDYHKKEEFKGFSLRCILSNDIEMYNIEDCMFRWLDKNII